ncbi:MAG TPA: polysaccharide biosynthesis/export family protein [Gemmataceae bacterium]|jgi:polysaccharide export outer membrane protein|nr:polysaccharide biosynthesis/export family protein [Gemmataceae bacterium]
MLKIGDKNWNSLLWLVFLAICGSNSGCQVFHHDLIVPDVPTEQAKAIMPPYIIDPPDVLNIDVLRLVPKPPYKLSPFDVVGIRFPAIQENLKKEDFEDLVTAGRIVAGLFTVEPEGTINLGPLYGRVGVADLTVDQARAVVEAQLKKTTAPKYIADGKVFLELSQFRGMQQIRGDHLVRPDGTVSLGIYGSVLVAGFDLETAKGLIEHHLQKYMEKPEISLDVSGYNSQVFYIIFDGAGHGDQMVRLPITGKETVLDAIGMVSGLSVVASKKNIFIARPALVNGQENMVLPVDWNGITRQGETATNYQIFPGDRLYVQAAPLITLMTYLDRALAPLDRVLGGVLLGSSAYTTIRFMGRNNTGNGTSTGGF